MRLYHICQEELENLWPSFFSILIPSSFYQVCISLDHLSLLPFFMAKGRTYSCQTPIPLIFRPFFFLVPSLLAYSVYFFGRIFANSLQTSSDNVYLFKMTKTKLSLISHPFVALLSFSVSRYSPEPHKHHLLYCFYILIYLSVSNSHHLGFSPHFLKDTAMLKPQKPLYSQNTMSLSAITILNLSFLVLQTPHFLVHCCLLTLKRSSPDLQLLFPALSNR